MNGSLLIIGLVSIFIAGLLFFKIKFKNIGMSAEKAYAALNPEKQELYDLAMSPEKVPHTFIYALTTCHHCRKTRTFLEENQVPFTIIFIDEYPSTLNTALMDKLRSYNPRGSFPTIHLPSGQIVTGYREKLLKETLVDDTTRTT